MNIVDRKMRLLQFAAEYYSAAYRATYREHHYQLNTFNDRNFKILSNFFEEVLKEIHIESLGINWIVDYVKFQWNYWIDKDVQKKIQPGWIFGPKAIERYRQVKDWTAVSFWINQQLSNVPIPYCDIERDTSSLIKEVDIEEQARQRHFNTDIGFAICIQETTLYTNKSPYCLRCRYKAQCKIILQKNYPNLYSRRFRK